GDVFFLFLLARKLIGLVERGFGFLPPLQAVVHRGQVDINLAVISIALKQRFDLLDARIHLPHIRELAGIYHFQPPAVGQLLHRELRFFERLLPIFAVAIGINDQAISALGIFVAQSEHFLVGINRRLLIVALGIARA